MLTLGTMSKRDVCLLIVVAVAALFAALWHVPVPAQHPSSTLLAPVAEAPVDAHSARTTAAPHPTRPARETPTATPSPEAEVHVQPPVPLPTENIPLRIVEPDGARSFDVALKEGDDLCANLEEARAEGRLRSLTIDDTWLSTYHSRYVREINGFYDNWTVSVNGTYPGGCSLYRPHAGDAIVWQFGQSEGI